MTAKVDKITGQLREDDAPAHKTLGALFSIKDSQWNTQSGNFAALGSPSALTFGSNKASFADQASLSTSSDYYIYKPGGVEFKTSFKRYLLRVRYTISAVLNSTSYGMIFGLTEATDGFGDISYQFQLAEAGSNMGKIAHFRNRASTDSLHSNGILPMAQGDQILFELTYEHAVFCAKYTNLTQNAAVCLVVRCDSSYSATAYRPSNLCNISMASHGGAHDLTELTFIANELVGLDLLLVGDSITNDSHATKTGRDWVSILMSRFPGYRISKYSGGYDAVFHYSQTVVSSQITALKPKNAFVLLGINDLNYGQTLTQLKTNYQILITALKTAGINVLHGGLIPNNNFDVRPFILWVRQTYPADIIVDLFSPLCTAGVNTLTGGAYSFNSTWTDDNLHPNDAGSLIIADTMTLALLQNNILTSNNALSQPV